MKTKIIISVLAVILSAGLVTAQILDQNQDQVSKEKTTINVQKLQHSQ